MTGITASQAALISAAFLFSGVLSGCAGLDSFGGSRQAVAEWAQPKGFVSVPAGTADLSLLGFVRGNPGPVMHVYIEGDGAAWLSPYHPPRDPTPVKPVALALAAQDRAPLVAYLGRPCQYLSAETLPGCPVKYWTSHRFAPEVLAAYQETLDALKRRTGASSLRLFGYSGGGVLAALLAMTRPDVAGVVTIAAPVSVAEWTRWHDASALTGSLDPASLNHPLPAALHLVGGKDDVVPPTVVRGFVTRSGGRMRVLDDFDHECCWSRDWQRLLEEIR